MTIFAVLLKLAPHQTVNSSEKISIRSTITKRDYEDVINGFLKDISFQPPTMEFDMGLKTRVENRLESYGISQEFITEIELCIKTATKISSCSYPFASREVLEAIALYATYVISIDDITGNILPDLQSYGSQLVHGQTHRHELLRGFTKFLADLPQLFGNFGGDMIIKGTMEFIASAVVEQSQNGIHLSRDASDYLVFFRAKTGVAEPFAFLCFPEDINPEDRDLAKYVSAVPNIMLFLGYVNDLLSFYKEELKDGDCPGFIRDYAMVHGATSLQALRQLRHETIEEVRKIRSILAGDPATAERIEQFIHGYIFYHLCAGRYRLDELDIPAAVEAKRRFHGLAKG
ncbi:terpenoid synthase [Aspergillus sclerotioniger CBS 115572]|uniref:Terpenoid synthase n=1 Tax=Aspergillus sclerotioniger CBS 115572 TaxID=1450535 RepID=A0A317WD70_9EURO|nr:terpenoid synthase [Aspergillus sclerotioniger CBS 115572]PWY83875.1 terpenoid synthase [Aspergillus sclerotioniger CBS 115572]